MKLTGLFFFIAGLALMAAGVVLGEEPPNPKIDFGSFQKLTAEVAEIREARRVSEEEFLRLSKEPGTVILDARAKDKYEGIHVKGALHLNFADFSEENLARIIPAKDTRVLIYCNNNFTGEKRLLTEKRAPTALNLSTFVSLYGYGYKNIYELAPLLDVKTTKIPFAGSSVK